MAYDRLAYNREWKAKRYATDPVYAEKVRERARLWRQQNKERAATRDREYYAKKTETDPAYKAYKRNQHKAWSYGMSLEQTRNLLASGRCAICGTTEPGGRGGWHIDHDHATGAVRDILCHHCNVGLGNFGDALGRLRAAVAYLEKHEPKAKAA